MFNSLAFIFLYKLDVVFIKRCVFFKINKRKALWKKFNEKTGANNKRGTDPGFTKKYYPLIEITVAHVGIEVTFMVRKKKTSASRLLFPLFCDDFT